MWNAFEHHIWNKLKSHALAGEPHYALAVSGGVDSMALALMIRRLKPRTPMTLMHFHHGLSQNLAYRDAAQKIVERFCIAHGCQFATAQNQKNLYSENDLRAARLEFFNSTLDRINVRFYLTGHHFDDVLETRLIKMIRGTGMEAFAAFSEWNGQVLRPFLETQKAQLQTYLSENAGEWIEDPSNDEYSYLRNWIRSEWLPQLDRFRKGSVQGLARSLQHLVDAAHVEGQPAHPEAARYTVDGQDVRIDRAWLATLNLENQALILLKALKQLSKSPVSFSQIKEIRRRLDKNQNDHIFRVAGVNWLITRHSVVLKL